MQTLIASIETVSALVVRSWQTCLQVYDRVAAFLHIPIHYCSQCEGKIRNWVYRFNGLIYCQHCCEIYIEKLRQGLR